MSAQLKEDSWTVSAVSTSNGYSLVRRVFADYIAEEVLPELEGKT